jgi:type VI protein secretion system component VasA
MYHLLAAVLHHFFSIHASRAHFITQQTQWPDCWPRIRSAAVME